MELLRLFWSRVAALFTRDARESNADREMRLHVRPRAQGARILEEMLRDSRHAARGLMRSPGLTLAVTLTLSLAIGANTAVFSVVQGVLLRPLPYPDADRLVRISSFNPERDRLDDDSSIPDYLAWKERATSFEAMETFLTGDRYIEGDRDRGVMMLRGSEGLLDLIGARPVVGRLIEPGDFRAGAPFIVLLTRESWLNRFGGDPGIVGRSIRLGQSLGSFSEGAVTYRMNVEVFTVAGVVDVSDGPLLGKVEALTPWVIETDPRRESRTNSFLPIVARLRPDVSLAQARAELDRIGAGLREQYGEDAMMPVPASLHEETVATVRPALIALLGATGLILLIAVSNIANLLLARGSARQAELSVRAALGAGRFRLARFLLTESLILSLTGGLGGVVLGFAGIRILMAMQPTWIPRLHEISLDATVLGVSLAVTVASGLLFGLAPVLLLRSAPMLRVRQASGGPEGGRCWVRSALVVSQLALSLVLLSGSVLMVRSFIALRSVPIGFDYRQIVTLDLGGGGFAMSPSGAGRIAQLQRFREALRHIRSLPGVEDATLSSQPPLESSGGSMGMELLSGAARGTRPSVGLVSVTENFFEFFGSRVVAGRLFEAGDAARANSVVVVDADLAATIWPGESAVGQRVAFYGTASEVIGVVEPIRYAGLTDETWPRMYHLMDRSGGGMFGGTALVRHTGNPETIMAAIAARLKEVDPSLAVVNVRPLAALYDQWLQEPRFYLILLSALGALGLVVAAMGVYGVVAFSVSRRTGEIGIRMALGARRAQIVGLFCRRTVLLIFAGLSVGLLGSLWLARYIQTLLFRVEPTDPVTLASTAALLAGAALVATLIPMHRALRVDPATTLRAE